MENEEVATSAEHSCPCGETICKVTSFRLDNQPWVEFDHGVLIHRFELDDHGRITTGPTNPRIDGA